MMIDKIEKANKKIDSILSYANSNKEKIRNTIINSLLLIVIFAVFGCFDFLTFKFDLARLLTMEYWTKTISKAVAGICAWHIGINLVWDKEIEKDNVLEENARKYKVLQMLKDQITFNEYIVKVFNPREKRKAFIDQINAKIYKLNKRAKNKDKLAYTSNYDAKNKYCVKRHELETMKTDEYIAKNIDSIEVKYNVVDPIIFELELDGSKSYRGYKVKGSVSSGKAKKTMSIFASMLCVSAILTSLGIGANGQQFADQMEAFWYYLLTCCTDTGIIAWQTIRGTLGARKIISDELTTPLVNRNRILTEYNEYCITNNIETSRATLMYQKIEREEKAK